MKAFNVYLLISINTIVTLFIYSGIRFCDNKALVLPALENLHVLETSFMIKELDFISKQSVFEMMKYYTAFKKDI